MKELKQNKKKTLVIGASTDESKYSNLAIHRLLQNNIETIALGNKKGMVATVTIENELKTFPDIHTITLYINPTIQKEYYNYILKLAPKRVIFNPGTENTELKNLLQKAGIETQEACTLVMLSNRLF